VSPESTRKRIRLRSRPRLVRTRAEPETLRARKGGAKRRVAVDDRLERPSQGRNVYSGPDPERKVDVIRGVERIHLADEPDGLLAHGQRIFGSGEVSVGHVGGPRC